MTKLEEYINFFNENDNEIYKNDIDNNHVYDWIKNEIPLFECPDKEIEQTYYFRWWTYRKHIKRADGGYAISEWTIVKKVDRGMRKIGKAQPRHAGRTKVQPD